MKIFKNRLVVVLLAVCMLVTGLFAAGGTEKQKANALSPLYQGGSDTIYYFTDYYPTLSDDELTEEFSGRNIVLDHQYVWEQSLNDLVESNYFAGFDAGCCVIIDIKKFMPDPEILYDLFYDLHETQGCITIFVSPYSQSDYQTDYGEYDEIEFLENIDYYIVDNDFTRLHEFVKYSLWEFVGGNRTLTHTTYFIDSALVAAQYYFGADLEYLCSTSIFLRVFVEELYFYLTENVSDDMLDDISGDYQAIASLFRDFNIKILVPTYMNHFVDILTQTTYCYEGDFYNMIPEFEFDLDGNLQPRFACAFGFTSFSQDYYDFLYNVNCCEEVDLPVYAYVVDPVIYDPNGLPIITDRDLNPGDCYRNDLAALWLLDVLKDILLDS